MKQNQVLLIELPSQKGSELINSKDIISVRANDKIICLSMEEQKNKTVKLSIGRAEKIFPEAYFVRCHRSYIVNVLKIRKRIKKQSKILLCNGDEIPVSRSYKKQLDTILENYCKQR